AVGGRQLVVAGGVQRARLEVHREIAPGTGDVTGPRVGNHQLDCGTVAVLGLAGRCGKGGGCRPRGQHPARRRDTACGAAPAPRGGGACGGGRGGGGARVRWALWWMGSAWWGGDGWPAAACEAARRCPGRV